LPTLTPRACTCLDVTKPDYGVVHAQALERLREGERAAERCQLRPLVALADSALTSPDAAVRLTVLALPADAWQVRYEKNDIVISARPVETSNFYIIRSSVLVPLPVERTHQLYTVRRSVADVLRLLACATGG
jgi:hypothetical protein